MVAAVIQPSISLVSQCVAIIRQNPVAWQILRVTSCQKSSTPSDGPLRGGIGRYSTKFLDLMVGEPVAYATGSPN
jgi:hypothetical protein